MARGPAATRHLGHLARGSALGLAGALFSALSGFVLVVAVARGLSRQEAGLFFSTTAFFLILVALASLGTETGLARFLLRLEADRRFADISRVLRGALAMVVVASVALGIVVVLAADGLAAALGWENLDGTVPVLLAIGLPLAAISDFALAGTRAFTRMGPTVLVDRFFRAGAQTALPVVLLAGGVGLGALTAAWVAPYAVAAVLGMLALWRLTRARVAAQHGTQHGTQHDGPAEAPHAHRDGEAEAPIVREFWRYTWPRGLTRLAQIVIQKADIVLVAALLSPLDAAIYTAATRFVALGQFATQALQQALQPRLTAILVHEDRSTLREVYQVATAWNVLVTWPVYLVIGCAPAAYLGMFGTDYASSTDARLVVVVMMCAMLLAVASGPVDTLLLMAGRSGLSLANASTAVAVDIGLCLLLLPPLGIQGAAIAWAAAVLTRCTLAFVQVRAELRVVPMGRAFGTAVAVCLGAVGAPVAAASLAGLHDPLSWVLLSVVLAVPYLGLLGLLRGVLRLDVLAAALRNRDAGVEEHPAGSRARSAPRGRRGGGARVRGLTGRLRSTLPAPVVRALRWLALTWGRLTARWRMTPSFVIVGAQRSGTTTLFRLFSDHPQVRRPTLSKGTGYFDDEYRRGRTWYRAHFPLRPPRRGGTPAVTFECSGYYMFHPHAPCRMARDLPDVRVVAVVRDPVERAYSAHQHELARGFESLPFGEAVALESARTTTEERHLEEDESYVSFAHRHHSYVARGEYDVQVARLHAAFGPDRVLVVDADAFFADPVAEFSRLQEWLGLPVWVPAEIPRWNARDRSPMDPELRERLRAHFESHDAALEDVLGRRPAWRSEELQR